MKKSFKLLHQYFESASSKTPQYLQFHKTFKKEFTELLKPHVQEWSWCKPNHFDVTGFFKVNEGQIFYFSIGDLRWSKDKMLIRTAKDFKDWTGGVNNYITLADEHTFKTELFSKIKSYKYLGN